MEAEENGEEDSSLIFRAPGNLFVHGLIHLTLRRSSVVNLGQECEPSLIATDGERCRDWRGLILTNPYS
jgi:hypothetical protein